MKQQPDITLSNTGRSRWIFQIPPPPGRSEHGHPFPSPGALIVGDAHDETLPPGVGRDPKVCPSPIVTFTAAEWAELGTANQRAIRGLVEVGTFEAENLPEAA